MKHKIIIAFSLLAFSFAGCKKLVKVDGPPTSVNSANIYEKDATAASVMTGIYTRISGIGIQTISLSGLGFYTALSSDELSLTDGLGSPEMRVCFINGLTSQGTSADFWSRIYPEIYIINAALEGVTASTTLTPAVKQQILGEAKFMRAFCYFYMVNLYGDVPLILTTDYKVNTLMSRTPKAQVWEQIIADLKDAGALLSSDYLDASLLNVTPEKVRPTKWAAIAMLARAYLYTQDWKQAEDQATEVINHAEYELVGLDKVFLRNSKEAIWQMPPVAKGVNTQEAITYVIQRGTFGVSGGPVVLNPTLVNDFEPNDQRKNNWVNSTDIDGTIFTYAYKYKKINLSNTNDFPVEEYTTILRLAEQYLIRAEAKIQQDKIADGIGDLNILRDRATDKTAPSNNQLTQLATDLSKDAALLAVEHERQVELFTEWGHRWLDLKRTGRVDAVMSIEVPKKISGGTWKSYQQLYPIPYYEMLKGPKLTQTEGY